MTDVQLAVDVEDAKDSDGPTISRVYPKGKFDLFAGDQAVLTGRYRAPGDAKITLSGKIGGEKQSFDFSGELARRSADDVNAFVAKLWATRRVGEIVDELDLKGHNDELQDELVKLATQHGILTPYTSFLADETDAPRGHAEVRRNVELQLGALDAANGDHSFKHREAKSAYQFAARPATAGAGGFGGGVGATTVAGDLVEAESLQRLSETGGHGVWFYCPKLDKQVVSANCMAVGRKTLFRRGEQWIDGAVTDDEHKSAHKIERFSREYFDLIERHGKHVAQYLAIDQPVCVKLDGEVYTW
jgi:Ca-activated chloride channel family protein